MENDEITPTQEPIFEIEETPFVPIRNNFKFENFKF